jgi:hypothetical protein
MAKQNAKLILKKAVPRLLKAAVWGSLTFILVYYLPLVLFPSDAFPFDYTPELHTFAVIAVFFAVVTSLFSGTILGCGFGVARAIVIIAYFFAFSDSGIFSVSLPFMEVPVNLTVDITIILLMIVSVNLLDIARNLLKAITFLNEKSASIELT